MSWLANMLSSTLGRKLLMALSGLFLCLFLVIHAAGNTQLFLNDGGVSFNVYTQTMVNSPFIKVAAYLTYGTILLHIAYSVLLTLQNRQARPVRYAVELSASSSWQSRNMMILGTVILIFLVIHMSSFWYKMKFGEMPVVTIEGKEYKDMYTVVVTAFSQWWYVAIYVVSMILMGFHLSHGFQSAFQSLGLNHKKYTPFIKQLGLGFSIAISALFAAMPIYVFLFKNING